MRARMAIRKSNIEIELREVDLKNKPAAMLKASPKATVPVLIHQNTVIDESLDIIFWALQQSDPDNWINTNHLDEINSLIKLNDNIFKIHLDHYKYSDRFPQQSHLSYREKGEIFLQQLEGRLNTHNFLMGSGPCLADIALFPFIRQFAYVDIQWFEHSPYPKLRQWLQFWLESDLFISIMEKYPVWQENQQPLIF
jgi:glutathione S-transferase